MVLAGQNAAEHREVVAGQQLAGDLRVISKGVTVNDWVIISGFRHVGPGMKVETVEPQKTE